jgi:hypothetical protein
MNESPIDFEQYVEQMAKLIDLPIPDACRSGIIENLERMAVIARQVTEFPLDETIEPASKFKP